MTVVRIETQGSDGSDALRNLRIWLLDDDRFRGRVSLVETPPSVGHLGGTLEAIEVLVNPAAGVLTACIVAWLQTRVSRTRIKVTRPDGAQVEIDSKATLNLDEAAIARLTREITRQLDP
jgi:hypothetical protein